MRTVSAAALAVVIFAGGALAGTAVSAQRRPPADAPCGTASAHVRTTLYFGLSKAHTKGSVSELEWQMFLKDEVTSRFPDGLTSWEAEGQWRAADGAIAHERSKVLLLVHPDSPAARTSVQTVIERYRKSFDQESVLWETARVCAAA
jgi:hypothetical protein